MLKPQDIVIAVKLLCLAKQDWSQGALAQSLFISVSEVNAGLKRLQQCNLIEPHADGRRWQVKKANFREFLLHGIAYVYPAQKSAPCHGLPPASSHPDLQQHFKPSSLPAMVWPNPSASCSGFALLPLYPSVIKAVSQDAELYQWLAIIDSLRDQDNAEIDVAKVLLREKFSSRSKRLPPSEQDAQGLAGAQAKTEAKTKAKHDAVFDDQQLDLLA